MESSPKKEHKATPGSATAAVLEMFERINRQDLAGVGEFLAEDCEYDDLHIFPEPMKSRKEVLHFFGSFFEKCGSQLVFIIDDITHGDPSSVGLMWHMECKGKHFPCSRGCSFYRLKEINGKLQVVYGRDVLEPPAKPGFAGLDAIKGVLDNFH